MFNEEDLLAGGHDFRLDRAEGMRNCLAALTHLFWMLIEPTLHRLENVLSFAKVTAKRRASSRVSNRVILHRRNAASLFCR